MEAYAIYKLIILYMLDRAGDQLAMPQISNFLFETGYATFTSLSKTFEEINADGFVEEHVIGDTTYLRITEEGEQTLKFFSSSLSQEIKEQVREFLRENSQSIRNDNDVTTAAERIRRIHDLLRNNPDGADIVQHMTTEQISDDELYAGAHSSMREATGSAMRADGSIAKNPFLYGNQPD